MHNDNALLYNYLPSPRYISSSSPTPGHRLSDRDYRHVPALFDSLLVNYPVFALTAGLRQTCASLTSKHPPYPFWPGRVLLRDLSRIITRWCGPRRLHLIRCTLCGHRGATPAPVYFLPGFKPHGSLSLPCPFPRPRSATFSVLFTIIDYRIIP